jgi:hypothetical protein
LSLNPGHGRFCWEKKGKELAEKRVLRAIEGRKGREACLVQRKREENITRAGCLSPTEQRETRKEAKKEQQVQQEQE